MFLQQLERQFTSCKQRIVFVSVQQVVFVSKILVFPVSMLFMTTARHPPATAGALAPWPVCKASTIDRLGF